MSRITDYSQFLSKRALRRKPSAIRELQPLMKLPGMLGRRYAQSNTVPLVRSVLENEGKC
jgi:hypothetical protein